MTNQLKPKYKNLKIYLYKHWKHFYHLLCTVQKKAFVNITFNVLHVLLKKKKKHNSIKISACKY